MTTTTVPPPSMRAKWARAITEYDVAPTSETSHVHAPELQRPIWSRNLKRKAKP